MDIIKQNKGYIMDRYKVKNRRFPKDFRSVADYIRKRRGIQVVLGESTKYTGPFSREIIIHHNYDLKHNGLYILLYECGKAILPFHVNRFDKDKHPQEYNYDEFEYERKCWEMGRTISRQIGLTINQFDFDKLKQSHLQKFFSQKVW